MRAITFDQVPATLGAILDKLDLLESKIQSLPETEVLPDYLDIDQLIEYLPSRPVKQTIYQLASAKKIPCFRVNHRLFFNKKEIDEWVNGKRKPTMEQLDKNAEDFINK